MLSNAYFLAKFRFDTAENEPAKILQKFAKFANFADPNPLTLRSCTFPSAREGAPRRAASPGPARPGAQRPRRGRGQAWAARARAGGRSAYRSLAGSLRGASGARPQELNFCNVLMCTTARTEDLLKCTEVSMYNARQVHTSCNFM